MRRAFPRKACFPEWAKKFAMKLEYGQRLWLQQKLWLGSRRWFSPPQPGKVVARPVLFLEQ